MTTKFTEWSRRIPILVEDDIETMSRVVGDQVADFAWKLDAIKNVFAAGEDGAAGKVFDELEGRKGSRIAQGLLSVIMIDPSNLGAAFLGKGDWTSFFGRIFQQILIANLIGLVFPPGALLWWLAFLLTEGYLVESKMKEAKNALLGKIGEQLFDDLQRSLPTRQAEIFAAVGKPFGEYASTVTVGLQSHLDEARAEQSAIIRQKQEEATSVDRERERLDAIDVLLSKIVGRLGEAFGRKGGANPRRMKPQLVPA